MNARHRRDARRDAERRAAISPGRNLLKSYGFKFKRAVTYFTRYNMISRDNHVDCLSQHCRRFLRLEFGPRWRRALPRPILTRSRQDGINGRLRAGPHRISLLPLPSHSPSNYSNVTTLLPLARSIYRRRCRYLCAPYLSLSFHEEHGQIVEDCLISSCIATSILEHTFLIYNILSSL